MSTERAFESDPSGEVIRIPVTSDTLSAYGLKSGHGSPEGSEVGDFQGEIYTDLDTGGLYTFTGTPGATTGWQ